MSLLRLITNHYILLLTHIPSSKYSLALLFTCRKVVVSEFVFFLSSSAKAGHTFEVAYHSRSMVYILTMAMRALKEGALIYMITIITDSNTDIETEIITTRQGGSIEQP